MVSNRHVPLAHTNTDLAPLCVLLSRGHAPVVRRTRVGWGNKAKKKKKHRSPTPFKTIHHQHKHNFYLHKNIITKLDPDCSISFIILFLFSLL